MVSMLCSLLARCRPRPIRQLRSQGAFGIGSREMVPIATLSSSFGYRQSSQEPSLLIIAGFIRLLTGWTVF